MTTVDARDRYRPSGDALAKEVQRMWSGVLRPRDIAEALREPLPSVLEMLKPIFDQSPRG